MADIHGNLEAFQAVLEDVEKNGGVDGMLCAGDLVGYGPDPDLCLELARSRNFLAVAGNHDAAAVGKLDISDFNAEAADACRWTGRQLSQENRDYLSNLPSVLQVRDFTVVHGSPRQPFWEYLIAPVVAKENLKHFRTKYCVIGHSHIPLYFECVEGKGCSLKEFQFEGILKMGDNRMIINPGGVGQPRDGDPRAGYLIFDDENSTLRYYRVEYDIPATQQKMLTRGLSRYLAARLSYGL